MITTEKIKIILILTCLFMAESKKKYPRIQDVFSFFPNDSQKPDFISRVVKDIKTNINIDTFRVDDELFRRQISGNLEDTLILEGKTVESRRVQVYKGDNAQYFTATGLQLRTKVLDSMLQLVYMARHYLMLFEKNNYIDKTSNAYRIGVIARKLHYLYKKSVRVLEILNVKQKMDFWTKDNTSAGALVQHHRVAKMHVDFDYYYLVLKGLHAKIREISHLPREKPPLKRIPQIWR